MEKIISINRNEACWRNVIADFGEKNHGENYACKKLFLAIVNWKKQ